MATTQNTKRKDKARVVLRKGESQRKDGKCDFRWTSPDGKRHSIYAATLEELREKENDIQRDSLEGIKAEACIDCGACEGACPTGAIAAE